MIYFDSDEYKISRRTLYDLIKDHLYARLFRKHYSWATMRDVFQDIEQEIGLAKGTADSWVTVDDAVNYLIDLHYFADTID